MLVTVKGIKGRKAIAHSVYDFSVDGGAFDVPFDLFKFLKNAVVHDLWYEVEEELLSAGAATMELGITGGDTDGLITQVGKAVLVANKVSSEDEKGALLYDSVDDHNIRRKAIVALGETLSMLIGTAAATKGKIHFYCEYSDGYEDIS